MALQATFTANFQQFDAAVKNAQKNVEAFEFNIKGTQRALQTMVSSFDGSRVIREATLMASAVEKIGGATKLTETETKRYNATIAEAVAKMNALGQDAPEAWKKIAAETEKAAKATEGIGDGTKKAGESMVSLGGIAKAVGGLLAATFTVGAVTSFAKEIIDLGGKIEDLSARTGLSVEAVQELKFAADQTGSSIDVVSGAISKMSDGLVAGEKGTVKAVKDLGLSLRDLRNSSPEEAFTAITTALKGIPNEMQQVNIGRELLGKGFDQLLPAVRQGFSDLRQQARETGQVLSEENVRALAAFGDKWDATMLRIKASTASAVLDIGRGFSSMFADIKSGLDDLVPDGLVSLLNNPTLRALLETGGRALAAQPIFGGGIVNAIRDAQARGSQERGQASLEKLRDQILGTRANSIGSSGLGDLPRELSALEKAIKALADAWRAADLTKQVQLMGQAFNALTPAEKANVDITKKVVEEYGKLRTQVGPGGLPRDLEAFYRAHLPVIDGVKELRDITGRYATATLPDLSNRTREATNMMRGFTAEGVIPTSKAFGDLLLQVSASNTMPWPVEPINNVGAAITASTEKTADLNTSLQGLAGAWAQLAQVRPLEGWIQDVAELIQLMNIGQQIGSDFRNAFTKQVTDSMGNVSTKFDFGALNGSEGTGNAIAAYANLAQTGVAGYGALDQATDVKGRGNRAAKGAMTGMAIGGAIVPGWGHLIGAGVGALVGALRNPGFEQEMNRIANDFGVDVSEELARSIDKLRKEFGGDRAAAEIFSLDKIIAEGGGVKDSNAPTMEKRLRDTFVMLETGKFTLDEARTVLDKNFATFAQHVRETEGLASKTFQEIVALNKTFDTNSKAIKQFVEQQTGTLGVSIANLAAPLVERNEEFKRLIKEAQMDTVRAQGQGDPVQQQEATARMSSLLAQQREFAAGTADEFERLGVIALGAFNAAVNAGSDWLTAVEGMGPALDTLIGLQKDLGIESQNAGLAEVIRFRDLVNNNQSLVLSTQALGETMRALSSIGGLNIETLAAMEAQGVQTFDRLTAAGFSEGQALRQMKGFIVNVIEAHEQLGIPIDENTQKLIDMAQEQGILKDDGKDMAKTLKDGFKDMKEGTDKLVGSIGLMVKALGADVPEAVQDAIDALAKIPRDIDINARVVYNDPGAPGGPSNGDSGNSGPEHGAAGGIYATGSRGVATWFGEGGQPELGGPVDFMGDVLSHALARLGSGRSSGSESRQEINVYLGEEVIARAAARGMPSVLDVYGATR